MGHEPGPYGRQHRPQPGAHPGSFVGFFTLSELGVNTAPLLAGAGVVGIAVGFGSQTLVKDVITGLFILLGDTVRVGDVVDLGQGGGCRGDVACGRSRCATTTARAHVPYSSISVVTNMTKDYAYAVFDTSSATARMWTALWTCCARWTASSVGSGRIRRIMLEPLQVDGRRPLPTRGDRHKSRVKDAGGRAVEGRARVQPADQDALRRAGHRVPRPAAAVHVFEQLRDPLRRSFTRPEVVRAEVRGGEA